MRALPSRPRAAVPLGLVLGLSAGCQDYLFEQKCPEGITESAVTVPAATPTPADILFVIDNSGSMAEEQANLARNFEFFINQIAGSGLDYRIALVSTDLTSNSGNPPQPVEREGQVLFTFDRSSPYMNLVSSDVSACAPVADGTLHACFRGPDATRRVIDSNVLDRDAQIAAFVDNVNVGTCGSGTEQGLAAAIRALEETGPGGCNEGFLRPDANLVIIFVSDEEDTDNTPVGQYVQDLTDFKDIERIRVAAIIGAEDGDASDCSTTVGTQCGSLCDMPAPPMGSGRNCANSRDCPDGEACSNSTCTTLAFQWWTQSSVNCRWCSFFDVEDCCSALAGDRYVSFARAVEARVSQADSSIPVANCRAEPGTAAACLVDSICQENFGETLERIARELVLTDTYTLDPAPENPSGISARLVGGRFGEEGVDLVLDEDFTIVVSNDGATATLTLVGDRVPGPEEVLDLAYVSEISRPTERRGACGPMTDTSSATN